MIKSLQAWRFVFAMMVVICHLTRHFSFGGEGSVVFFFILSGFVLAQRYGDDINRNTFSTTRLLRRQIGKMYPLYLTTLLVVAVLDAKLGVVYGVLRTVLCILLLQSWIPSPSYCYAINGPAWFLSSLLFLYLIFRQLYVRLFHWSLQRVVAAMILLIGAYVAFALTASSAVPYLDDVLCVFPPFRVIDFAIGILLARFCQSQHGICVRRFLKFRSSVLTSLSCTAILIVAIFVFQASPIHLRDAAMWLFFPLFIVGFALTDGRTPLSAFMGHSWLQKLGAVSFDIYLTHMLSFRIIGHLLIAAGVYELTALRVPCMLVGCIAVAVLFHWLLKLPNAVFFQFKTL